MNENGEIVKKEESGPWNKKDGERSEERESPVVETKPMPKADDVLPGVVGGAYVPPSRRGLGGETGGDARLEPMKPRMRCDIIRSKQCNIDFINSLVINYLSVKV